MVTHAKSPWPSTWGWGQALPPVEGDSEEAGTTALGPGIIGATRPPERQAWAELTARQQPGSLRPVSILKDLEDQVEPTKRPVDEEGKTERGEK